MAFAWTATEGGGTRFPLSFRNGISLLGLFLTMFFGRLLANDCFSVEWRKEYMDESNNKVRLVLHDGPHSFNSLGKCEVVLIGTTGNYYFVQGTSAGERQEAMIIPSENIFLVSKNN